MNKRTILSLAIIILAFAAIGGATMAWFTAEAVPLFNSFEAGTVSITAGEEWAYDDTVRPNWNPGDCDDKSFIITNTGSKGIKIRGILSGKWYESDGVTEWTGADPEAVTIALSTTEGIDNSGWTIEYDEEDEVFYLYFDSRIPGTYDRDTDDGVTQDDLVAIVTVRVCLDGELADNNYQEKVFKLTTKFQAIQASHGPGSDSEVQWDWDSFDGYNE